jgi:hypothetical protein
MKRYWIIYIVSFTAIVDLSGQTEKQILPEELKQQTIVEEPLTLPKGFLRLSLSYNYTVLDKLFNENWKKVHIQDLGNSSQTSDYGFYLLYGLTNRLQINAYTQYTKNNIYVGYTGYVPSLDTMAVRMKSNVVKGFQDLNIDIKYQLLEETPSHPSLVLWMGIILPTASKTPQDPDSPGSVAASLGDGVFKFSPSVSLKKRLFPYYLEFSASLLYSLKGKKKFEYNGVEESFQNGSIFYFDGTFGVQFNDWLVFANALSYTYVAKSDLPAKYDNPYNGGQLIKYQPSIYFQIKRIRFVENVSFPIFGKTLNADPQYSIILQYIL